MERSFRENQPILPPRVEFFPKRPKTSGPTACLRDNSLPRTPRQPDFEQNGERFSRQRDGWKSRPERVYTQRLTFAGRTRKSEGKKTSKWGVAPEQYGERRESQASPSENRLHQAEAQVRDYAEKIARLESDLKKTKERLREVIIERDKLISRKRGLSEDTNSRPDREVSELYSLIWKELIRDSTLNPLYIKRDLASHLDGKGRDEIEETLEGYDLCLSKREIGRLLQRFTIAWSVDVGSFVAELGKHQPYLLYEDFEPWVETFRLHFAVRNISKPALLSYLSEHIPTNPSKRKAVTVLTDTVLGMEERLAELVYAWVWKGRKMKQARMDEVQDWSTVGEVVWKLRMEFAIMNIRLEEVPSFMPIPLTPKGLHPLLTSKLSLTSEESTIFTTHLFPPNASFSLPSHNITSVLSPPWILSKDLQISTIFRQLLSFMTAERLVKVATAVKPVSETCISLSDFLAGCEAEFQQKLSQEQRDAIEIFCYTETKKVDAVEFRRFLSEICSHYTLE